MFGGTTLLSPIVCIIGPTGTGKSQIALSLAKRLEGTVINTDSRQVYKDFPIITDQPSMNDICQCPHKLYGFLETKEQIDAGQFASHADQAIANSFEKGRLPILVGGTGLYFKAILYGLAPIPNISEDVHNKILGMGQAYGYTFLYQWLQEIDSKAGQKIHKNDRQRITRALEVYLQTKKPITWWQGRSQKNGPRYQALKIGLFMDPLSLYQRLIERIEDMLSNNALKEINQAWKSCPDEYAPGWSAIGCQELLQYFLGRFSLDEAREEWIRKTKAYAKRQMTWFRKESGILWYQPDQVSKIHKDVYGWLEQK